MKYLSVSEVAEQLGNHEKTVRRYIVNGDLQAKKVGGQWRIADSWLARFLNQDHVNDTPACHQAEGDFCVFMDSDFFQSDEPIQVCTIIDVKHDQADLAELRAKSVACDILQRGEKFKIEVQPQTQGIRIVLWGQTSQIQEVLEAIK